jgi:hypothetical protein
VISQWVACSLRSFPEVFSTPHFHHPCPIKLRLSCLTLLLKVNQHWRQKWQFFLWKNLPSFSVLYLSPNSPKPNISVTRATTNK